MSSDDVDFLARLQEAALRARASGFDATAEAIEAIVRREVDRRASLPASSGEGCGPSTSGSER